MSVPAGGNRALDLVQDILLLFVDYFKLQNETKNKDMKNRAHIFKTRMCNITSNV